MTTDMAPITALFEAENTARAIASEMLPLITATLRVQYPTSAYLVLYRNCDDELYYHSVRGARGETVFRFPRLWLWRDTDVFPHLVPAEIAALWPDHDPSSPATVLSMIRQIDQHGVLGFLAREAMWPEEECLDKTPVGIPLQPVAPSC
ncbi:hypothetical protein [Streptomyces sp. NPDC046976]|uniref:hypothetical protein n=1 Tax=Streptomyces sp. NPDC046976 TaxID=3155258 RepID=UPI0033E73F69